MQDPQCQHCGLPVRWDHATAGFVHESTGLTVCSDEVVDDDDPQLAELQDLAADLDRCPVCCRPWTEHADYLGRAKCIPIVPVSNALAAMQRHAEHATSVQQ